jgi:uncharacterized protein (TIGR00255 family)
MLPALRYQRAMLRSMTGFGRGEAASGEVTVLVELRSVNNRFRDLQIRTPREYVALEPRISQALKKPFQRGRIDAFVRRSATAGSQVVKVDADLADQYMHAVHELRRQVTELANQPISLDLLISQPGVLTVAEAEVDVMREWAIVETALEAAVADLLAMRDREGQALRDDLQRHLTELRGLLTQVEDALDGIHERLHARVQARVQRLVGDRVDPARLAQEAAVLADKADVSEEVARLRSHCDQFREALASELDDPVGRRLEFLLQEMHREVNTIGSKAVEHPVSQRVVDMKSVLERMREQAANVE